MRTIHPEHWTRLLPARLLGVALGWSCWAAAAVAAPLEVIVRDRQGLPVAGAVVALERAGEPRSARAGATAEMGQRNRQFEPRLLVVQTGTEVQFPNHDKVRHHVYSFSPVKPFELQLYLGKAAPPVRFDKSGVLALGCNIHDQMSAFIVVVDTARFAITDEQGRAVFDAGGQTLRAWHSRLPELTLLARPAPAEGGRLEWALPL
ncbi:MAG: methylamine utilization protein [Inhella sp.]|jgi:plastocyanin|uniref:methylamine utilization protein n=1 Tax=Inhella sp. TaxID=1921806 RepID=UPI0022BF8122|nr:methylamine utilization protein [Inhella sp.]MCZ8233683.1 methylamine utilization protein [Inhella sp.]